MGRAETQRSHNRAMLVSTGWHRERIKYSTAEIAPTIASMIASMYVNVGITCYYKHYKTVLLWNGHHSTSPARKHNGATWPASNVTVLPTAASLPPSGEDEYLGKAFSYLASCNLFVCVWKNPLQAPDSHGLPPLCRCIEMHWSHSSRTYSAWDE